MDPSPFDPHRQWLSTNTARRTALQALVAVFGGVLAPLPAADHPVMATNPDKGRMGRGRHRDGKRCAKAGEPTGGMRKRKGRKARLRKPCCDGLVVGADGLCAPPPAPES